MESITVELKNYLTELYNMTEGDTSKQVSMYDVGISLGLDKAGAGAIAEETIVEGWVELVSLAGGVSITTAGMTVLGLGENGAAPVGNTLKLGTDFVLGTDERSGVEDLVARIRSGVSKGQVPYAQLEEIVIDLKTIDVQLLSPKPKTGVVRELFRSLKESCSVVGLQDIVLQIEGMIAG